MELRESILEGTLKAFNQKGLKFTMMIWLESLA